MNYYEKFEQWLQEQAKQKKDFCSSAFESWRLFIDTLDRFNIRDGLIARLFLYARPGKVLSLKLEQIDFDKRTIDFSSKKSQNIIELESEFLEMIQDYIDNTSHLRSNTSLLFLTRKGKAVTRMRLNYIFNEVEKRTLYIVNHMTPDNIRDFYTKMVIEGHTNNSILHRVEKVR